MDPKISSDSDKASSQGATHNTQSAVSESQGSTVTAAISLARNAGGPRTANGKERSKKNAVKHGLLSRTLLLKDEPRAEFDYLLTELHNDRQPVGMLEIVLVDKLAAIVWRYRRLLIAERQQFEKVKDFIGLSGIEPEGIQMELVLRYGASLDRELDRILKQLERCQRMRLGQPVPPSLDVNIAMD